MSRAQAAAVLDATMSDLGASRLMLARQRGADGVVRWSAVIMREDGDAQAQYALYDRYVVGMYNVAMRIVAQTEKAS